VAALSLLAPAGVLVAVFFVWPVMQAVWLGFTRWKGFDEPRWVGLGNYQALFADDAFITSVTNNAKLLVALPVWVFLPFLIASALHGGLHGARSFRLAFFLPVVLSPVVIGTFWNILLRDDGPINEILTGFGLPFLAQPWLAQSATALPALVVIAIWSSFGIGVVIFLAALGSLDPEPMDAARIDGAGWWALQRHVVLPAIRPVVEFWAIIVVITSFTGIFPLVFTLTAGGPGFATHVLEYDIYREAFANGRLGYASAIGVVLFLLVGLVAAVWVRVARRAQA
jgi:ABC-type sugar transport system permease subunit